MNESDPRAFAPRPGDLAEALRLLTRLPLPASAQPPRGARAAWAWPLAGLAVGAAGALAGGLAAWAGSGPGVAAALAIGAQAMASGALHEDGLADTFDGLWGGRDRARRLAIMRDSRIGTYGVLALLVVTLVRWSALAGLYAAGGAAAAILAVAALSRAPMIAIMAALPSARADGLSSRVGRPGGAEAAAGAAVALASAGLLAGWASLALALAGGLAAAAVAAAARARIGGQTGDILGASQQLAEAAMLGVLAAP